MTDIMPLHAELVTSALDGDGHSPSDLRRGAYDNARLAEPLRTLNEKVALYAYRVTDDDIAAVRATGFTEDQIFELVVCAAIGQSTRQYEAACAALATATEGP